MARLTTELTTDFSVGMVDSAAPTAFPRQSCASLVNARIQPDATLQRRPGSIKLHEVALTAATGYGGSRFTRADGEEQLFVVFGAEAFYTDDFGVTWSDALADDLREGYWSWATMRVGSTNYLFGANGGDIIRWDGTTLDTLPNAPNGMRYIAVFNGRLWGTGHSGNLVQASAIADPTLWTSPDGLTVQVITHSGDTPTGLFQVGPHLLVFDRHATSYIDGFGEQTIIIAAGPTGFSRSVGCVGFRTIAGVGDNGVAWMSERGIEYYAPNVGIILLSAQIQGFLNSLDWTELYMAPERMSAAYDDITQNYYLALSAFGAQNNRVLVLNIQQNAQYQRPGPRAAASVDQLRSPTGGDVLMGSDDGTYLSEMPVGSEADTDAEGYLKLVSEGGVVLADDADGYLTTTTNNALPGTLFVAASAVTSTCLYSLGYDGFVRRHADVDADDMEFDGTGGTPVTMSIVSRPFLMGRARQRKRVRAVHVSIVHEDPTTVLVAVRGGGTQRAQHALSFAATALAQSRRKQMMTNLVADEPQVEVYVTSDAKVSLIGVSAELLRERVA